jgi:uncharacterized RDD family membrane protein YckC
MNVRRTGGRVRDWLVPDRRDPTQVVVRRTVAYLVDALLIAGILLFVIWVTGDVKRSSTGCPDPIPKNHSCIDYSHQALIVNNRVFVWFTLLLIVLFAVFFGLIPGITGASPGKSLLRIRVVRADGTKPGWKRGLLRSVCWGLDGLMLLLPTAMWLAALTPRHRRLGDYVASTYVVRRDAAGRPIPLHRPPGDREAEDPSEDREFI